MLINCVVNTVVFAYDYNDKCHTFTTVAGEVNLELLVERSQNLK